MKALIVYDSLYGNTEKIAMALAEAVVPRGEVKMVRAGEADVLELPSADLLIIGSPTHGGRPTPAMLDFLDKVPASSLQGIKVAAFDTRASQKWVKIFGFAAGKIADSLKAKGAAVVGSPGAFFVKGKEGPLKEGEPERAAAWGREIANS